MKSAAIKEKNKKGDVSMQKVKKYMGLAPIALAFVFLFNPNINLIDVLPDFVGYAILLACLSRLSDINEDIEQARIKFLRALIVDVVKFFSVFFVFGTSQTDEQNTMLLLLAFSFAVVECIVVIPAYVNLFKGFITLGYKFENNSVLKMKNQYKRKNITEKTLASTVGFVILKAAAYTLPEFSVLSSHTYDESSHMVYLYDFVGLLRGFSMVVMLVIGPIWLARIIRYFSKVKKDKVFMEALGREYSEKILPRESLFVRKTLKLVFFLFGVAAVLLIDFRIDYFNLIPDTAAALVLIAAAFAAKKRVPSFRKYFIPFVIYAVFSLAAQIIEHGFFSEYYYSSILKSDEAYSAYKVMIVSSVFDALSFIVAVNAIIAVMAWTIKNHTGFFVPDVTLNVEDKIKRSQERLNKRLYLIYGSSLLCVASDIFYDFGIKDFGFAGIVNTAFTVVFIVCYYTVANEIYDEVESKYMLE